MKSKVFFSDMRTTDGRNLQTKLVDLIRAAGFETINFKDHYACIKIHFGEEGNLAYLRPNWAKSVVDEVKRLGGKAFLTDCNTLYVGSRKNAIDHLETATLNGYGPLTTGAHVIIADGLKGSDDVEVPVEGGKYVKEAKIGRAIMDADIFISLSHFKGHEATGFGGALKNIGMGSGSRRGKMEMHNQGKPKVITEKCIGCHKCTLSCAHYAQVFENRKCRIVTDLCVGCGRCLPVCPVNAIVPTVDNSAEMLNCRMMEYAKAVVDKRDAFHISIITDVSPLCDCYGSNDSPIVPNIGMFASFDPVALDQACADAVNNAPMNPNTMLTEAKNHSNDYFSDMHPDTDWKHGLKYAEEIGLGSRDYELIRIK